MNKNQLLDNAWSQICDWAKGKAGEFEDGVGIQWSNNPYCWIKFVVNSNGEAFIYWGNHAYGCPEMIISRERAYELSNGASIGGKCVYGHNCTEDRIKELCYREWDKHKDSVVVIGYDQRSYCLDRDYYPIIQDVVENWAEIKRRLSEFEKKNFDLEHFHV